MIDYKIHFIKTNLKEVTQEDVYKGAYQVYYEDKYWDIIDVDDYYHIIEIELDQRMSNNPIGIKIKKDIITEIYEPVIKLVDISFNQLLVTGELIVNYKFSNLNNLKCTN